jgi:hypothetical protein
VDGAAGVNWPLIERPMTSGAPCFLTCFRGLGSSVLDATPPRWTEGLTRVLSVHICSAVEHVRKKPSPRQPRNGPRPRRATKTMARKSRSRALLVLHLNTERLRADGLSLEMPINLTAELVSQLSEHKVRAVSATSLADLESQLASIPSRERYFGIVVVAHGNVEGVRTASDQFSAWPEFAQLVRRFQPVRLLLVACQAGQWHSARQLYQHLPRLRDVFACPANARRDLGALLVALAPALLGQFDGSAVTAAQALAMTVTGGQLRHWTRADMEDEAAGAFLDLAALVLDPVVRDISTILTRGSSRP